MLDQRTYSVSDYLSLLQLVGGFSTVLAWKHVRIAHDRSYSMYCACVLLSKIEEELLLSSYIAVTTTRNATAKLLSGKIFKLIRRLANMLFHFLHAMIVYHICRRSFLACSAYARTVSSVYLYITAEEVIDLDL